jgi:hypothetical protein
LLATPMSLVKTETKYAKVHSSLGSSTKVATS